MVIAFPGTLVLVFRHQIKYQEVLQDSILYVKFIIYKAKKETPLTIIENIAH